MNRFFIRVELHGPRPDYDALHERMTALGASKEVTGRTGRAYRLPSAEYQMHSPLDALALRDLLIDALADVRSHPKPWILVIDYNRAAWTLHHARDEPAE